MALSACGTETSVGVTLFIQDPADSTYKEIGKVTDFPSFAFTHGTASCDTADSRENGWKTMFKTGKLEAGTSSIGFNWTSGDAVQQLLYTGFIGTAISNFRMVWSDASNTQLDFKANITGWGKETPNPETDDAALVSKSIDVELSGEPVWS